MAEDERLSAHAKVQGAPHYRFYAGIALRAENGMALGTLCVLDTVPRPQGLTRAQEEGLHTLAQSIMGRFSRGGKRRWPASMHGIWNS